MSVLSYPRIHMKGKCLVSPATGNNDDVGINIDVVNAALLPSLAAFENDDDALAWMMGRFPAVGPDKVTIHTYLRSGWNYFGTMRTEFQDVVVTSVVGLDGKVNTQDPVVGKGIELLISSPTQEKFRDQEKFVSEAFKARVSLFGKATPVVCDVDPMGSAMAQLFVGGLSLGDDSLGFNAQHDTRAFSRWVLFRNASTYQGEQFFPGAGATWQFGVPHKALKFFAPDDSPALRELRDAAGKNRGILAQFCFYLPVPELTDVKLIALFENEIYPENPVTALVVGTLGVWEEGELETAPAGRLLRQPIPWPPPAAVIDPAANFLGPALARIHPGRDLVSLNLITTFPEADFNSPPEKADLGRVRLGYIPASGCPPIPISGPLNYDAATYEKTGGILDVPYDRRRVDPSQLEQGTLVLLAESKKDGSALTILTEADSIKTVATDDCGVYLDVGDSREVSILVRERDRPPSKNVKVYLREYQYAGGPAGFQQRASFLLTPVEDGPPLEHRLKFDRYVEFPANQEKPHRFSITALKPGGLALAFTLEDKPLEGGYPWDAAFYTFLRVMPDDGYSSFSPEKRVSWHFMYENVFRYYYLIFPAMSKIIPFNCQEIMEENALKLVEVTDPRLWHSTHYMPITRDLSSGKRQLIVDWAKSLLKHKRKPTPRPHQGGP